MSLKKTLAAGTDINRNEISEQSYQFSCSQHDICHNQKLQSTFYGKANHRSHYCCKELKPIKLQNKNQVDIEHM